jgi:hypothetical protein
MIVRAARLFDTVWSMDISGSNDGASLLTLDRLGQLDFAQICRSFREEKLYAY